MYLKQLSIFVENQSGRLADIAEIISSAGIDIRAISVADTSDFGILRLIVDRPDEAKELLSSKGLTVSLTDVIAVSIADKPGEFARVLRVLFVAGIAVEYMYAFITRNEDNAYVILRVADNEKASAVITDAGMSLLDPHTVYNM
ncbi:MAG: ACT domain-containing protein [Clostridia bacterium]|nr:ACT domain-containing protein [Clostridia bacterium]